MPPIASDALVLRTYQLGETSKVVVLLTRERGKLRAVAKGARGARSRYQSALEPLSEVTVSLHGRQGAELFRLGECELVRSAFRAGSRGLESALALSYFAELLDAFAQEGEAEDAVYRLALAVLAAAESGTEVKALARYLEAWLLRLHGIYPPLDRCAGCGGRLQAAGGLDYHGPGPRVRVRGLRAGGGAPPLRWRPGLPGRPVPARPKRRAGPAPRRLARAGGLPPGPHPPPPGAGPQSYARPPGGRPGAVPMTLQEIIAALRAVLGRARLPAPPAVGRGGGRGHHAPGDVPARAGPRPWRVAYVQPSRRPADGRYGENPNRLYKHHQYQVILKPAPADVQDQYLGSLVALGIDPAAHDVRFEEDNWESPTLGAWGIGWQVLLDGQEITQFTYFQQAGGIDLAPISAEITYGLERIAMYLQDVDDVYTARAGRRGSPTAACARRRSTSSPRYSFELADAELHRHLFDSYLAEGWRTLQAPGGRTVLAAYDWCLKSSHAFNVLDARGAISVSQRAGMILGIRKLACAIAAAYVAPAADAVPAGDARA